MNVGERIYSVLTADSGVSALVGTRVTPTVMPQGSALPAIVYTVIFGGPVPTVDGPSALHHQVVQIDCYSHEYDGANAVANAVAAALAGYASLPDVSVVLESSRDLPDEGVTQYQRKMMQFSIWGADT